jgi:hypothetical protein
LRVDNGRKLGTFFNVEKIDTKLGYAERRPLICVRGRLTRLCKPGDRVYHPIETYDRKDGKRIRGVDLEILWD